MNLSGMGRVRGGALGRLLLLLGLFACVFLRRLGALQAAAAAGREQEEVEVGEVEGEGEVEVNVGGGEGGGRGWKLGFR
jgi:hypothetical protein